MAEESKSTSGAEKIDYYAQEIRTLNFLFKLRGNEKQPAADILLSCSQELAEDTASLSRLRRMTEPAEAAVLPCFWQAVGRLRLRPLKSNLYIENDWRYLSLAVWFCLLAQIREDLTVTVEESLLERLGAASDGSGRLIVSAARFENMLRSPDPNLFMRSLRMLLNLRVSRCSALSLFFVTVLWLRDYCQGTGQPQGYFSSGGTRSALFRLSERFYSSRLTN